MYNSIKEEVFMTFKSILYADSDVKPAETMPAFFQDLQLDYILEFIEGFAKGYNLKPYYYTLPSSAKLIHYRQQIFSDLSNHTLLQALKDFCHRIQKSSDFHALSLESEGVIQSATYHLKAASMYLEALLELRSKLDTFKLASDGLLALKEYLSQHILALNSKGFEEAVARANEFFFQMRFQLTIEEERITIVEEEANANDCIKGLANALGEYADSSEAELRDIFPNALEPSYLEAELINILKKSKPHIFKEIRSFHEAFPDFYDDVLLTFINEIQFYLSFMEFRQKTETLGYTFCTPALSEESFKGRGIYDLALVWKHTHSSYTVVANDFNWTKRPSFFVVTGPNQGGKTTFARSMGQAVYLSIMGLPVNGMELTLPLFNDIATHFEAEENLQSNSGKLKEELNRLKPMMHAEKTRQFVILNELFTTATTHDALIMGRRVMEHFLAKECYGIYVTHIQELAEESESIISLVAQVEESETSDKKRTYRILPMKAQGYGYSDSLVKQFELDYEDIIRRLS